MSRSRIVRLLDGLTPKQKAMRKWRTSPKGIATTARAVAKAKAKRNSSTELRAAAVVRATQWRLDNVERYRVYNRIRQRNRYVRRGLPSGTAQLQYFRTCACGRTVRGNAFTNHVRACQMGRASA